MKVENHHDFPKFDHRSPPSHPGRAGLSGDSPPLPRARPWGGATRSPGEFSNGASGENYSGINTTHYRWRSEYGGLKCNQVKRLKELEQENTRLLKAVAELTLDKLILKEAAKGNW
jgi:hypothetical protein